MISFRGAIDPLRGVRSIARKLKASYVIIIVVMLVIPVITIISSLVQSASYDRIIKNVSLTNRLNLVVKGEISNELWDVVAGSKKFEEARHYSLIGTINDGIVTLMKNTGGTGNRRLLEVADRAMETLESYVERLGFQEQYRYPVSENEKILEEIRGVSALVSDILQDYIVLEIETADRTNERMKLMVWVLAALQVLTLAGVTLFASFAERSVARSVNRPIKELEVLSTRIASGDLDARAEKPNVAELDNLTENLNIMAAKIKDLIRENILEQRNLQKSEMKALQAQITPHFLYNTLDTIIWLAEAKRNDAVIDLTRAFSNFFRISLSRGREWITLGEEIDHVRSYLTIQKIRYRDILDYSVEIAPELANLPMLKLTLQPLVENALYHGIKHRRIRGVLAVRALMDGNRVRLTVTDNGIGMTDERLAEVLSCINEAADHESSSCAYGLFNVNRRLMLYYNGEARLAIESEKNRGTTVTVLIPTEVPDV